MYEDKRSCRFDKKGPEKPLRRWALRYPYVEAHDVGPCTGVEDLAPGMMLVWTVVGLCPSLAEARGDRIISGIGQGWLEDPSLCPGMQDETCGLLLRGANGEGAC